MSKHVLIHSSRLLLSIRGRLSAASLMIALATKALAAEPSDTMTSHELKAGADLHFDHYNFSAYCFETKACKVTHNGEKEALYEEGDYSPRQQSRKSVTGLSASHLNFAASDGPLIATWRSKDGNAHQAIIDMKQLFVDHQARHRVARADISPDSYIGNPDIFVVINDRQLRVLMRTFISLKNTSPDESQNDLSRFDEVEVYSHDFAAKDESAENLFRTIAEKRPRHTPKQVRKPNQSDDDRIQADYESIFAQLKAHGASDPYNEKNEHDHLFIAMFDSPRFEPSESNPPSTRMSELRMTLDRIADSHPKVRAGYINAPAIYEFDPPDTASYLDASNLIARRMYERVSTQTWEWKQSDPDADVILVTLMEGAGTLQAIHFLDIARELRVVDRASIRGREESVEDADLD